MSGYLFMAAAYLLGSIPFGLLFGKILGVDVRAAGSGNIGATNVNRLLGRKMGFLTLVCDALKAVAPMTAAAVLFARQPDAEQWVMLSGAAAFVGHLYPLYLKFKGGKGVATALGVFFYLHPPATVICIGIFIVVVAVSGYVSLGSLLASAAMPVLIWYFMGSGAYLQLSLFVAALIWVKHYSNIVRLVQGRENSIRKKTAQAG